MTTNRFEVAGKVALVTGANRGIGRALVEALVAAGAQRVYAGMRHPSAAGLPENVIPIQLDVTDPQGIRAASALYRDTQLLINNAGVALQKRLLGAEDTRWAEQEMRVNYFGTLDMVRAFAPVLIDNGGGAIVNVLSLLSRVNMPDLGSYSATKAAAYSLTQGIRAELAQHGTLVVGVLPGFVDTEMASFTKMPKVSAALVASETLRALREGLDEVYPGPASDVAGDLLSSPKKVERYFANTLGKV